MLRHAIMKKMMIIDKDAATVDEDGNVDYFYI